MAPAKNRTLDELVNVFDMVWAHRHGDPSALKCDSEFHKGSFRAVLEERNIAFEPAPARRHSENGKIERKHRTIKDILDRIALHLRPTGSTKRFNWVVSQASFLCNALYGNKLCSSFELARKFTPSILGSGSTPLPDSVKEAELEMRARRLWARLQRCEMTDNDAFRLAIGDPVVALIPDGPRKRGQWRDATVHSFSTGRHVIYATCDGNVRGVAPEDVRPSPHSQVAADAARNQLGCIPKNDTDAISGSNDDSVFVQLLSERGDEYPEIVNVGDHDEDNSPAPILVSDDANATNTPITQSPEFSNTIGRQGEPHDDVSDCSSDDLSDEEPVLRRGSRSRCPPDRLTCKGNPLSKATELACWLQMLEERFGQGVFMIVMTIMATSYHSPSLPLYIYSNTRVYVSYHRAGEWSLSGSFVIPQPLAL